MKSVEVVAAIIEKEGKSGINRLYYKVSMYGRT